MKNSEQKRVIVSERGLLVTFGQSKKLTDICKKSQQKSAIAALPPEPTGLKPERLAELNKARKLIDDKIWQIMQSFPEGKKNSLFAFKFGSVATVKTLPLHSAFKTLAIDTKGLNMKLLAQIDYHGNNVDF